MSRAHLFSQSFAPPCQAQPVRPSSSLVWCHSPQRRKAVLKRPRGFLSLGLDDRIPGRRVAGSWACRFSGMGRVGQNPGWQKRDTILDRALPIIASDRNAQTLRAGGRVVFEESRILTREISGGPG